MTNWDETHEVNFSCQGYEAISVKLERPFIALEELQRYFNKAVGLSCIINGKTFCMIMKNNGFQLENNVYSYQIRCISDSPKKINFSQKRKTDYANILAAIKGVSVDMERELKKESTAKINDQVKTRTLILIHKHRDGPTEIPYKLKPRDEKQLALDFNGMYTVDDVLRMGVPLFKNELNHLYFEKCDLNITSVDGRIIEEFKILNKFVGLWKYLSPLTDRSHRSILCILTTYSALKNEINSTITNRSEENTVKKTGSEKILKRNISEVSTKENVMKKKVSFDESSESSVVQITKKNDLSRNVLGVLSNIEIEQNKSNKKESHEESKDCSVFFKAKNPLRLDDISNIKVDLISLIPKEQLEFGKDLGRGSYGVVREGTCNGTPVAIKSINSFSSSTKAILKEISALRQINHVNIVSIMGASSSYVQFHIVMELVRGNSLRTILFEEDTKKKYKLTRKFRHSIGNQLCAGISWMHLHPLKIIHRDIKPDNILVQRNDKNIHVKICDLGLAKIYTQCSQLMSTQGKQRSIGTPFYMAPEILMHKEENSIYSDVWSLAGTIVELYSEKPLWILEEGLEELETFMKKEMKPPCDRVPKFLNSIIQLAFDYTPKNRPTSIQIKQKFDKNN